MVKKDQPAPFRLPSSPFVSPALKAGDIASGILNKAFSDRGFTTREIITQWKTIVGPDLATVTAPDRLRWPKNTASSDPEGTSGRHESATLHIRVDGPVAIEVQHLAPQIIERINQFFGYPAIGSIRIIQAPVSRGTYPGAAPPAVPGTPDNTDDADEPAPTIPGIADPGLAAALSRLGRRIRRK